DRGFSEMLERHSSVRSPAPSRKKVRRIGGIGLNLAAASISFDLCSFLCHTVSWRPSNVGICGLLSFASWRLERRGDKSPYDSLRQSGQVMDGRSSLRSVPLRVSPGPKFRVFRTAEGCPPSRVVSSPKRDRKKERACYGVCQEDHEIVQDKTGETAGNPQGKNIETIRRAQSQAGRRHVGAYSQEVSSPEVLAQNENKNSRSDPPRV